MTVLDTVSTSAGGLFATIAVYVATHHDGLVALSLFVGVIITFSGRTLLKPTVFLLGFIPATITIIALGLALLQDENPKSTSLLEAIVIGIALFGGIFIGIIMLRLLFRIATFALCAGFGAVIVFVFHLFLLEPIAGQNALFVLYAVAIFSALVAGLFSVSYPETGIILGTAFDGSALAVYSLARFLGHRPSFSTVGGETTSSAMWWSMGYGAATVLLGVFGALTQRQVAAADHIIAADAERKRRSAGMQMDPMAQLPYGFPNEGDALMPEPPRTPLHMRSGIESPMAGSAYGAIDDDQDPRYSVVHNLGAAPLGSTGDIFQTAGKETTNGPHPL